MASTEVSNVIRDIIDGYKHGLNIFRGGRQRHKRRHSESSKSDIDTRIQESLTQRPREIKQAYDQSVSKYGQDFEVGDNSSQSGLARILLVFNSGLIKLLNQALSPEPHSRHLSRSSLLDLSESAAKDTITALSELSMRLTASSRMKQSLSDPVLQPSGGPRVRSHSQSSSHKPRRPSSSPQLKNGAWIRSKSDPSIVSVVVSQRNKRGDQARESVPRLPTVSAKDTTPKLPSSRDSVTKQSQTAGPAPVVKPKPAHLKADQEKLQHSSPPPEARQPVRQPSMYIVPSDFFKMFPQLSLDREVLHDIEEDNDELPPLCPPKVPLHSRPRHPPAYCTVDEDVQARRGRPTSMMTFMTASTKIGEIPEHLLPDRELTAEQQEQIPMPYVLPEMLNPYNRRGRRTLRFWKKDRAGKGLVGVAA